MLGVYSLFLLLSLSEVGLSRNTPDLNRDDFPAGFVFGAGTSSYQVEGAVAEDGRTPSVWDSFTHAGRTIYEGNADVSSDQYHKYKEDVKLMGDVGIDGYRFSISWSRLLPYGRGAVNPKGLRYYNNLINELVSRGIQPHVTIYHLDLPQVLEDEYEGWLSPKIVEDFTAYADVCFREFGDRVTHWTTINQPNMLAVGSYDNGLLAPGRCSHSSFGVNCTVGNSSVEPYIAAHHALLAHASAATLYREKYQGKQNGWIGISVYSVWLIPLTNSTADIEAAQRALHFYNGWIINPVLYGDYPEVMKRYAGSRIPSFTKSESEKIKGSIDFIGINHYVTMYVQDDSDRPKSNVHDFFTDMFAKFSASKEDGTSGQVSPFNQTIIPSGLTNLLLYFKNHYGNPPIYVHENGFSGPHNESLNDTARVEYLSAFINATLIAIRNGSNTRGYFVWSFLDVFEFLFGYRKRLGLYHVDFEDEFRARRPKLSAHWYSKLLKKGHKNNIEWATL